MKKRATTAGVQMFSFLDAMICTLGALLVLLHAFARHGQEQALRKAEAKAAQEARDDRQPDLEMLKWRIEQLQEARAKTDSQLADERLKLSHVEDHQRRLLDKLQELKLALAELDRLKETDQSQRTRDLAALEAARVRLVEARHAVDEARGQSQRKASYNVVPYEGPNATHRRPVYIECGAHAMILQPEGVELTPADFAGFLGPGNPLAAALRGTREYYARQTPSGESDGEPYPLLLVRPEGVDTYYAARSALDSWGSDFGYELIGSDWNLKFAEPDPRLAELLRQIVTDASRRMRELMIATEQLRSHRPRAALRASSNGGFVTDRRYAGGRPGRSRSTDAGGWDTLDSAWARGGSSSGSNGDGAGDMDGGSGDAMASGSVADSSSTRGGGTGSGSTSSNQQRSDAASGSTDNGSGRGNRALGTNGMANDATGTGQGTSPYDQVATGSKSNVKPGAATGDSPGAADGSPGGQSDSSAAASNGSTAGSPGGSGSSDATSQSQSASGSVVHSSLGKRKQQNKAASLATSRGRDWGLPDAGDGTAPVTRPILVRCHADRLVIVPEDRNHRPTVTRLGDRAQENIDEFVAQVWQHMKGWGIAGRGLYWRPTLVMDVEPGAADRYAEIKTLLADSGLDVRERRPQAAAAPVTRSTRQ